MNIGRLTGVGFGQNQYTVKNDFSARTDSKFLNFISTDDDSEPDLQVGGGESFDDVYDEMSRNVPDRTSTIEEKKLAISYIDRLLACADITPELKTYWQNKKSIIEQEILRINNEEKSGSGEKVEDVWKEISDFMQKYGKAPDASLSAKDVLEFNTTYETTFISFLTRLLNCTDITQEQREQCIQDINQRIFEMQHSYNEYIKDKENN